MAERPVAMKGEASFFDGQVGATLVVARAFDRLPKRNSLPKGKGGYDAATPELADVFDKELNDPKTTDYEDLLGKMRALQVRGYPLPPVTLRLKLTNRTKEALDVEILELNSDLGNFAVRPSKLSVPAEQTAEPDPMHSQLGVTSDEIPVKLVLRHHGKREVQTVLVKNLFTPEAKPASSGSSGARK